MDAERAEIGLDWVGGRGLSQLLRHYQHITDRPGCGKLVVVRDNWRLQPYGEKTFTGKTMPT